MASSAASVKRPRYAAPNIRIVTISTSSRRPRTAATCSSASFMSPVKIAI
jgi:hypothetical protein